MKKIRIQIIKIEFLFWLFTGLTLKSIYCNRSKYENSPS